MGTIERGRAFWERVVDEYEDGGTSHAEVADRYGVSIWSFRTWLYRLRRERQSARGRRELTRVLPVEVVGPERRGVEAPIQMQVGGVSFNFAPGVDPRYIAALAAAVRSTC